MLRHTLSKETSRMKTETGLGEGLGRTIARFEGRMRSSIGKSEAIPSLNRVFLRLEKVRR